MHELSIATALVDRIADALDAAGGARASEVTLKAGELRQIVPDLMRTAFVEASRGTPAEGAVLHIEEVEARVRCRLCRREYRPAIDDFTCPACRVADAEVVRGDDIILQTIEARPAHSCEEAP